MLEQYSIELWEWLVWHWYAVIGLTAGIGLICSSVIIFYHIYKKDRNNGK